MEPKLDCSQTCMKRDLEKCPKRGTAKLTHKALDMFSNASLCYFQLISHPSSFDGEYRYLCRSMMTNSFNNTSGSLEFAVGTLGIWNGLTNVSSTTPVSGYPWASLTQLADLQGGRHKTVNL